MNIQNLTTQQKRDLVKSLRAAIADDIAVRKAVRANAKAQKEASKQERIQKAIIAAQEKLAKLQAKLA